jgi:hypothetical protein
MRYVSVLPDQVLVDFQDTADSMTVIVTGHCVIRFQHPNFDRPNKSLKEGDFFGEMTLLGEEDWATSACFDFPLHELESSELTEIQVQSFPLSYLVCLQLKAADFQDIVEDSTPAVKIALEDFHNKWKQKIHCHDPEEMYQEKMLRKWADMVSRCKKKLKDKNHEEAMQEHDKEDRQSKTWNLKSSLLLRGIPYGMHSNSARQLTTGQSKEQFSDVDRHGSTGMLDLQHSEGGDHSCFASRSTAASQKQVQTMLVRLKELPKVQAQLVLLEESHREQTVMLQRILSSIEARNIGKDKGAPVSKDASTQTVNAGTSVGSHAYPHSVLLRLYMPSQPCDISHHPTRFLRTALSRRMIALKVGYPPHRAFGKRRFR